MKIMKKVTSQIVFSLILIIHSSLAIAKDGNTIDLRTRCLKAKADAYQIVKNAALYGQEIKGINFNFYYGRQTLHLLNDYSYRWLEVLKNLEFDLTDEKIEIDYSKWSWSYPGVVIKDVPGTNIMKVSKNFRNFHHSTLVSVIIQESLHKLNFDKDDIHASNKYRIGLKLVEELYFYKNIDHVRGYASKHMKRMPYSIRSKFDSAFIEVAKNYRKKGEGLKFAYTLIQITRHYLNNSNLASMFKYLSFMTFYIDKVINPFETYKEFANYKVELLNKLLNIVIDSSILNKEDGLNFLQMKRIVQYALGHLNFQGHYFIESEKSFDRLVATFTEVIMDKRKSKAKKMDFIHSLIKENFFSSYLYF